MTVILWIAAAMAVLWLYGSILSTAPPLLRAAIFTVSITMWMYAVIDAWDSVAALAEWTRRRGSEDE